MVAQNTNGLQQSLLDASLYVIQGIKPTKKRVRYKNPTYIKKYQLKRFNEETQEFFYDSDEKHIFRSKTLQNIHTALYFYAELPANATESYIERIKYDKDKSLQETAILCHIEQLENWGIRLHFDEEFGNQAEIIGTEMLPLGERLKKHIKLLKLLKRGYKIKEAIEYVKEKI